MRTWYASSTGNHQGLVIEDETGRNVAVTYDKDDAALVAAAPALLAALEAFLRAPSIGSSGPGSVSIEVQTFNLRAAHAAVAEARGQS